MTLTWARSNLLLFNLVCFGCVVEAGTPVLRELFDAPALPADWMIDNKSSPPGPMTWQVGPIAITPPKDMDLRFAAVNYESAFVADSATADNWLLSPELTFRNGVEISFETRKGSPYLEGVPQEDPFADRLQLWIVPNTSTDLGTHARPSAELISLFDINSSYAPDGYPFAWTTYGTTLDGLTGDIIGRLGFRYFIEDTSAMGNEIWLDNVEVVSNASGIPEPTGVVVLITLCLWVVTHRGR